MQRPALDAPADGASAEAEREQLLARHDGALTIGDGGDQPVGMHN